MKRSKVTKAELVQLLTGYIKSEVKSVSPNPIGENGLILRVRSLNYLSHLLDELDQPKMNRLLFRQSAILCQTMRVTCHSTFTTEYLQVMDHPRSKGRENLTVELCHEYFQGCADMTTPAKDREDALFDVLKKKHIHDGILEFRNMAFFHLDKHTTFSAPGTSRGSRREMMALLLGWFDHVVTSVYGSSSLFVTMDAVNQAKVAARDLRRVLLYSLRYGRARFERRGDNIHETPAQWFDKMKAKPET